MSLYADIQVGIDRFALSLQFDVRPGETVAVLGPNGSGKTTALRALAGLLAIEHGMIRLDDEVLDDAGNRFVSASERDVGMVFQRLALFEHMSVRDNVAFGLRTPARRTRQRPCSDVDTLLERFELVDLADRRPNELSGGQAQRVALARAVAPAPRLLLLDEPLAALDASTRVSARRVLRHDLAAVEGMRVLVAHDPADVFALADRVVIVDAGAVVQAGTVAEVAARPRSGFVADLVGTNLIVGTLANNVLEVSAGVSVPVIAAFSGPAWATIRPQSVTISRSPSVTSARISLAGTIAELAPMGDRVNVLIDGAVPLRAEVTTASVAALGLEVGLDVVAQVKSTDVAVYPV